MIRVGDTIEVGKLKVGDVVRKYNIQYELIDMHWNDGRDNRDGVKIKSISNGGGVWFGNRDSMVEVISLAPTEESDPVGFEYRVDLDIPLVGLKNSLASLDDIGYDVISVGYDVAGCFIVSRRYKEEE